LKHVKVNGKDDIPWKIKAMFETTKQQSKMVEHVGISSQTNDA